jgi:carbonic anhydrase
MPLKQIFKTDFLPSIVVFLIALPLSLGISLASGAPMKSGLIAAVIGGIVVGFLSGAPLQVSGPAAGLSVMIFSFIQKFGFETTCIITLIAGLTQLTFGFFGAAQIAFVISPAVIHAMLAGIGILITLGQTHVLLGFTPKSSAIMNIFTFPSAVTNMNLAATLIGLITLGALLAWTKWGQKKINFIPGSLVAVVFGTSVAYWLNLDIPRVKLDSGLFESFNLPSPSGAPLLQILLAGLGLALVASAESLLCAVATDKLHDGPRVNLDKELKAQGVGNLLSGILGGLPITGVIVRSSANIAAGAKSNMSAVLHGFWILVFAVFFSGLLNQVPLSVLAALLIYTGIKLVKINELKKLIKFNESIIYFATLFGVVFISLLWGIAIGFTLALVAMILQMVQFRLHQQKQGDNIIQVSITGNLTFLAVPKLLRQLNHLPKQAKIELSLDVDHLDHAAVEALHSWRKSYEKNGGIVCRTSFTEKWRDLAAGSPSLSKNSFQ